MIGVDDEEDYEPFVIGKMLIELIADHEQAPGVEIVRLEE